VSLELGAELVCELVAAGRGAAARPAFAPGLPVAIGKGARGGADVGDLVTVVRRGRAARVVAVHGPARSPRAALRALLASEDAGLPFPHAARLEAEALTDAGAGDPGRRDMRGQEVVTIDPEGAKDHDDAIAAAQDGDGWRVWVHIADVSRFVPAGGPLDREAARRGNSIYVPGSVDPMLPERLSSDLCSLRPGVDRNAVTVDMRVAADGTVGATRFHRSTIRSGRRFTYPEVDALLVGGGADGGLAAAGGAARALLARRRARGALEAAPGEPTVTLAGDRVVGIRIEGSTPSHSLVEELMVAANEAVARFLIARGAPTVFRFHEDPAEARVRRLYDQLAALDVPTPPLADGPLGPTGSRAAAVGAAEAVRRHLRAGRVAPEAGRALWSLVLRALRQAVYTPDAPSHSGLASPAYLHFTSPIRRYPDLLVHRALLDALGVGDPAPGRAELAAAAAHASDTERAAAALERRADAMCAAFLLEDRLAAEGWDAPRAGAVTGVIDAGLFVSFDEVFEGFLPARRLEDDHFRLDPLEVAVEGVATGRRIRVGDRVDVRVVRVEALRGRVELEPAGAERAVPSSRGTARERRGRGRAVPRHRPQPPRVPRV
jgi:ribonuclease R